MKTSIRIAYLKRKIRQLEEALPECVARIEGADAQRLAMDIFERELDKWKTELCALQNEPKPSQQSI